MQDAEANVDQLAARTTSSNRLIVHSVNQLHSRLHCRLLRCLCSFFVNSKGASIAVPADYKFHLFAGPTFGTTAPTSTSQSPPLPTPLPTPTPQPTPQSLRRLLRLKIEGLKIEDLVGSDSANTRFATACSRLVPEVEQVPLKLGPIPRGANAEHGPLRPHAGLCSLSDLGSLTVISQSPWCLWAWGVSRGVVVPLPLRASSR